MRIDLTPPRCHPCDIEAAGQYVPCVSGQPYAACARHVQGVMRHADGSEDHYRDGRVTHRHPEQEWRDRVEALLTRMVRLLEKER